MATLVAEVYGPDRKVQRAIAGKVLEIFDATDGVVDADWYVESPQPKIRFVVDREKAALAGVDPEQVASLLTTCPQGAHGRRGDGPAWGWTQNRKEPGHDQTLQSASESAGLPEVRGHDDGGRHTRQHGTWRCGDERGGG